MSQTHKRSMIEASTQTGVGFLVSLVLTATVLPLYGFKADFNQYTQITLIFTAASLLRGYVIRRVFNGVNT